MGGAGGWPRIAPLVLALAACLAVIAKPGTSIAQCPGGEGWIDGIGQPGVNGDLYALAELPDGDVIAGGLFSTAGGLPVNNIARYSPTTNTWSALGSGTTSEVVALAVLPDGDVIAGGLFSTAGGVPANNIARYRPSTNTWSALGSGTNDTVWALAVLPDGDVIAIGLFSTAGGVPANNIARYRPSTDTWSALASATDGSLFALAVLPDGDIITGGVFSTAGGVPANNIARYHLSTNTWSALGSGTSYGVDALAVLPDGDVIAGGVFSTAGGVPANNIARYRPSTNTWSALGSGMNELVAALAVLPDGDVVAGGYFTSAGGVSANRIARYNPTTNTWSPLGSGTNDLVQTLAVLPDGDVVAGGDFTSAGGVSAQKIARYDTQILAIDGTRDCPYGAPLHVQANKTQFGDSSLGQIGPANGSELDSVSAYVKDATLYLHLAGNLESNGNTFDLFFDTLPGGQNALRGDNNGVDFGALNRMGYNVTLPGLTFDSGFAADRYITVRCGADPARIFVAYAEVLTNGGGAGNYLGETLPGGTGTLTGGTNPYGIRAGFNNSNTAGVAGGLGAADQNAAAAVTTGIELAIPLSALGLSNTCGSVKLCAFINSGDHGYVSNQVLGSLAAGTDNLAESRSVNFATRPGAQFVEIPLGGTVPSIGTPPASATACVGEPASFSVANISGTGPFTYAWFEHPSNIPLGSTGPSLAFASVQPADAGSYYCVVTGACGSVTSASATLTVNQWPSGPSPSNVSACVGEPASFSVAGTTGTGPFTYQWYRAPATIVPGETISVFTLPAVGLADAGSYYCVITGACGSVTSDTATLTVTTCCSADFDQNGSVSVNDLFAFLGAWFAQNGGAPSSPSADFDNSGTVSVNDLFAFLGAWFAQNGVCG